MLANQSTWLSLILLWCWWRWAWWLKKHSTMRGRPNLAVIGSGTGEPTLGNALCIAPAHRHGNQNGQRTRCLPGRHCTSHLYWKCTHQSTERWVEFRGFLKYQLMVASPLWPSMLCLASWFVLLKLQGEMQTMQRGMAWNCWCWRCLDFYCKRLNPTWQSTKWTDSKGKEGYAGRWKTLWPCQVQVCCWVLIRHGGRSTPSNGIKIDWCWLGAVSCSNWVIDLIINTRLIC